MRKRFKKAKTPPNRSGSTRSLKTLNSGTGRKQRRAGRGGPPRRQGSPVTRQVEGRSTRVVISQANYFTASRNGRPTYRNVSTREQDGVILPVVPQSSSSTTATASSPAAEDRISETIDLGEDSSNSDFLNLPDASDDSSCAVVESGTQAITKTTQKKNRSPGYELEGVQHIEPETADEESQEIHKRRSLFRRLNPASVTEIQKIINVLDSEGMFDAVPTDNGGIINVRGKDIKRLLKDGIWLNDEVINSVACIINRANEGSEYKSHIFNSFFYDKLCNDLGSYPAPGIIKFNNVECWSKNIDIAALDIVMFPINVENIHWTLAYIDMRAKLLSYIDSLYHNETKRVNIYQLAQLRAWLYQVINKKRGQKYTKSLDIPSWKCVMGETDFPQQDDWNSCGVFAITSAMHLASNRRPRIDRSILRTLDALLLRLS